MNIGYIKLDNPKKGFLNSIFYKIRKFFNFIYKDKYRDKVYYICNVNEKSVNKLINRLKRDNIDYIIAEKDIKIDYPKLTGKFSLKYMLPEVVKYCFTLANFKLDEIFICTNNYTEENKQIIEDLTSYVKVVNVVTDNSRYISLEKQLERKGIYITVNNNKRKSLKRANVVVNLDFKNIKIYNINRNMIVIDVCNSLNLDKGFDGIHIKGIRVGTDKVMRVFSEYENFDKDMLIEAEMIRIGKYEDVRKYVNMNKFKIEQVIGEREIQREEFERASLKIS